MTGDYTALGKKIEERYAALKALRTPFETLWQEVARYVMPRRSPGMNGTIITPGSGQEALLFDTTAVLSNMTLAAGFVGWMSPLESPWFAFAPVNKRSGDEERLWLSEATEIAREELAISNFYTSVHEFYLDLSAFGTACLYMEPGRRESINAQVWPAGSFVVDEDDNGIVDTVIREFLLTPRQAVQKFGEDKVSPKMKKAVEDPKKAHERHRFLHAVYPREDAERDKKKMDGANMEVASVYLEVEGCHVCQVGGYEEMPVMVSRYLEWGSGMGSLYGWSPSFAALPEARQLNFLQKMADAVAEKTAFPPVMAPDELEGEVDVNAFGVTYFSADIATRLPRVLQDMGRGAEMLERIKERQQSVKDAFMVDLFSMFSQIDKQMTAREVAERSQEKLVQFSPSFSRLTNELFNPMLARLFGILLRGGKLGDVPQIMIRPIDANRGYVETPKVQYSSRIALALRSLPTIGYSRTLEREMVLAPMVPDVLDNFDFDKAERATALSDGVPAEYLRSEADRDELRAARAQAQAQAMQQQQAAMAADSLSKVGRVPPESAVGKVIEGGMNGAGMAQAA